LSQRLERGKPHQRGATFVPERIEIILHRGAVLKAAIRSPQRRNFYPRHAFVVDQFGRAQPRQFVRKTQFGDAGKSRCGRHVDIERIQKQPAVRRVGTGILGTLGEQGMEWIEADAGGAKVGGQSHKRREVAEIPMAPVRPRPHGVELDGQEPMTARPHALVCALADAGLALGHVLVRIVLVRTARR
jgi:hypothetical protein